MKKNLVLLIALVGIAKSITVQASQSCATVDLEKIKTGDECTTSKGAVFTRLNREGFGKAWKDPSGLIWGESSSEDLTVVKSVEKCFAVGGDLPFAYEYDRFRGYFEQQENKLFTDNGQIEVKRIMPDMKSSKFWTGGYNSNGELELWYFSYSGKMDSYVYISREKTLNSVRCVVRQQN